MTAVRAYAGVPHRFERLTDGEARRRSREYLALMRKRRSIRHRIRRAAEREEELLYRRRASGEYLDAIRPIGTDWVKPHIADAPFVIVVFEEPWGQEGPDRRKHYHVRESVGIAVGFLLAALHNAGLATLTHAPSPMGFLREILKRPENERHPHVKEAR